MSFEIVMGLEVRDDAAYQRYREGMMPILESFGGAFGYDFRVSEVLRAKTSDPLNRVFTIEFPSRAVMDEFFEDPDYLAVRERFFDGAVGSKTVISMHHRSE